MTAQETGSMAYRPARWELSRLGPGFAGVLPLPRGDVVCRGKETQPGPLVPDAVARHKVIPYGLVPHTLTARFGRKWILVTGCFDGEESRPLPHAGHTRLLRALATLAPVVVGVESDDTAFANKADLFRPRPLAPGPFRALRVARLPYVAASFVFADTVLYGAPDSASRSAYLNRFLFLQPPAIALEYSDSADDDNPFGQYRLAEAFGVKRVWHERPAGRTGISTTRLSG